ncbi:MAG: LamG-like jellyroll fold domain-containing protein [Chthoniobacter sp.]
MAACPTSKSNGQRSPAGAPLAAGTWKHLAVVAESGKITLYLDGAPYATLNATLPGLKSPAQLGESFAGEIDELEISRLARPAGWIKLAALGQGPEGAAKLLKEDADEAGSKGFFSGGFGLFGTLLKAVTIDGWVVIGVLAIMAVITWIVMVTKFFSLRRIEKGTAQFIEEWSHIAADLTQLDQEEGVKKSGCATTKTKNPTRCTARPSTASTTSGPKKSPSGLPPAKKGSAPGRCRPSGRASTAGWRARASGSTRTWSF